MHPPSSSRSHFSDMHLQLQLQPPTAYSQSLQPAVVRCAVVACVPRVLLPPSDSFQLSTLPATARQHQPRSHWDSQCITASHITPVAPNNKQAVVVAEPASESGGRLVGHWLATWLPARPTSTSVAVPSHTWSHSTSRSHPSTAGAQPHPNIHAPQSPQLYLCRPPQSRTGLPWPCVGRGGRFPARPSAVSLVRQGRDSRQNLSLEELERCAATGRDVRHLRGGGGGC